MLLESTINGLVAVLFLSSVKVEFISTYTCKRAISFRRLLSFFLILSFMLVKIVECTFTLTANTYVRYFSMEVWLSYTYCDDRQGI